MKSSRGFFFEDFTLGRVFRHATPVTVTSGDVSLYRALTGSRHALYSSEPFSGLVDGRTLRLDPLMVFHIVFGKSVPDISRNAVANLGYAEGVFGAPVYRGDTLRAESEIIGHKQNSSGKTGIVYVRTRGLNQRDDVVVSYIRWVMVNKRDPDAPAPKTIVPELRGALTMSKAGMFVRNYTGWDSVLSGSPHRFEDYEIGEKIDHVDGMTVEEAEHQIATRLYQNTAKVHFDAHAQKESQLGRRLIYGGVVMSIARALSFNGLANAVEIIAINAGTHVAPLFAGDTVYAWSEVLDMTPLSDTTGALRLRLVATKDQSCEAFPLRGGDGAYDPAVLLDFDYWAAIPRASL